jgi:Na+/melibiose symporter-like transporter
LVIAVGLLLMARITPGDSYASSVLPAVVVFGLGLTLVVAPVTATALATAGSQHSGVASGVNNAVSRVGGLLAVAILPLIAGLTGHSFYDPASMTRGFGIAMETCAALAACGGLLAWLTIRSDALETAEPEEHALAEDTANESAPTFSCDVAGAGLRPCNPAD